MCSPTLIDAPVKPMLATWCWPQPFGQPLILMLSLRVSSSVMSIASIRSCTASLRPIELVIPSLHESVPGHETTSLISREPASPRPSSDSARQRS